jgi:hypothetical protein
MAGKESPQGWQYKAQYEVWCLKWTLGKKLETRRNHTNFFIEKEYNYSKQLAASN